MNENKMYRQQGECVTNKETEISYPGRRALPWLCMCDTGHKGRHMPCERH